MNIPIKPLSDYMLVKEIKEGSKTHHGLYLPDRDLKEPKKGLVVAVGPSVKEIKIGDSILHSNEIAKVSVGDSTYLLINSANLYALINE